MHRQILQGDVLEKLKDIKSESIDCIITSPPYWGLRDYGVDGQLGLESDFRQYLEKMGIIMKELKRVLKKTGTCWINLGDTYAGGGGQANEQSFRRTQGIDTQANPNTPAKSKYRGMMGKSRFGIPERFYINCIDNGWIARNHIPWYKSNSMPSSVKDRFTNKWESIFFFAKNQKYYFNLDAVREKSITETKPFNVRVRDSNKERFLQKALDSEKAEHNSKGEKKQDITLDASGKPNPTYKGFNERWKNRKWDRGIKDDSSVVGHRFADWKADNERTTHESGKNPGDVFFINPKPFPESHFATFPVELPERILKCACPENGIVLDPFFGAGTVGVAAEKLNRQWIGIELNPEYIKIAEKRLKPYMNDKLESFTFC